MRRALVPLFYLFEAACAFAVFGVTGWTLAFLLGAGLLAACAIESYRRARRVAAVYACLKVVSDALASLPITTKEPK